MKNCLKIFRIVLAGFLMVALHSCASGKNLQQNSDCQLKVPRDIPGLIVRGARPRRNVIENLHAIRCGWENRCIREKRTDLNGTIFLKLTVDKVGDIGVEKYHSTIADSAFVESLVFGLYLLDFDPWNDTPGSTEIECPIVFGKKPK